MDKHRLDKKTVPIPRKNPSLARLPHTRLPHRPRTKVGTSNDSRYYAPLSMSSRTRLLLTLPLTLANMTCNADSPASINVALNPAYLPSSPSLITTTETKITAPNGNPSDLFGFSVALSGDILVVGTPYEDSQALDAGAAYVFVRTNGQWTFEQKLVSPDFGPGLWFGYAVAIDGNKLIIGAPNANGNILTTGAAYLFVRSNGSWLPSPRIAPSDGKPTDMFGQAVDIAGDSILIGSPRCDAKGIDSGAAYVFAWNGTTYIEQKKLYPNDAKDGDHFGSSVAMNGETAVVGAPDADLFGPDSGSAYAFVRQGNLWSQQKKFIPTNGNPGDGFGWSVDIDSETAIIGSPMDDAFAPNAGAAYIFQRTGIAWNLGGSLSPMGFVADDRFGSSVAISGASIAVGALLDDTAGMNAGAAYLFTRQGTSFSQDLEIAANDAAIGDAFGFAVAISGQTVVATAYLDDDLGTSSGAAYIYELRNEDGEPCTTGAECLTGYCVEGLCCDTACDLGPCDACSKAAGSTSDGVCTLLDGAACDDGDACTLADTCFSGQCIGSNSKACTKNETCAESSICDPATGMCVNASSSDGNPCNDGNACTKAGVCQSGVCHATALVTCPPAEVCHEEGTCNAADGNCVYPVLPDGTICPEGTCQAGICVVKQRTILIVGGGCACSLEVEKTENSISATIVVFAGLALARRRRLRRTPKRFFWPTMISRAFRA